MIGKPVACLLMSGLHTDLQQAVVQEVVARGGEGVATCCWSWMGWMKFVPAISGDMTHPYSINFFLVRYYQWQQCASHNASFCEHHISKPMETTDKNWSPWLHKIYIFHYAEDSLDRNKRCWIISTSILVHLSEACFISVIAASRCVQGKQGKGQTHPNHTKPFPNPG